MIDICLLPKYMPAVVTEQILIIRLIIHISQHIYAATGMSTPA